MSTRTSALMQSTFMKRATYILISSCFLSACSMAPVYERPDAPIPIEWHEHSSAVEAKEKASSATKLGWQEFILDENLRALVATALENNRDLRQAVLNIEAARAEYRVQRADRVPNAGAVASGTRQRVPADLSTTGQSAVTSSYGAGIALTSFEIDLFGRVKSLSDAALQNYFAIEANANAARISLIVEVVQAYLSRDGAVQKLALTRQTLDSRIRSLELISKRREAGTVTALDYQEALGLREQAKAEYERLDREFRQASNALQLLVGVPDIRANLPTAPIATTLVQQLASGAPSNLLENRPDILAAEYQLRSRNASIGAARAAFFPRISLTAGLGTSSADLSNLFDDGQRSWSFVPQLTLPIFQGGRNVANLDLANVRKDIAIAQYEKTIQVAFREVSDALAATDTLGREEASRRSLSNANLEALRLSEARYKAGVDSHLRYLEAQRNSFTSQLSLIEVSTSRQIALATLFKSLGGGWKGVQ